MRFHSPMGPHAIDYNEACCAELIFFLNALWPMELLCGWWWWCSLFLIQHEKYEIGEKFKSEVHVHDMNPP